jgi:hypothetical protein
MRRQVRYRHHGLASRFRESLHASQSDAHAGERSRTGRRREAIHLPELPAMPIQQFRESPEKHLAEALGRMQQHLFQHLRAAQQRQAAEFVRGVYSQNQFVHLSSW